VLGDDKQVQIIVDVGVNRGMASDRFLKHFRNAQSLAFEPEPEAFKMLNDLSVRDKRIHPYQFAIGDVDDRSILNVAVSSDGSSLLSLSPDLSPGQYGDWTRSVSKVPIVMRRLDTVYADLKLNIIDVLKIDTQGYDLRVLKSGAEILRPDVVRSIICEINFIEYYEGRANFCDISDFLISDGYKLVGLYNCVRNVRGVIDWCDSLWA